MRSDVTYFRLGVTCSFHAQGKHPHTVERTKLSIGIQIGIRSHHANINIHTLTTPPHPKFCRPELVGPNKIWKMLTAKKKDGVIVYLSTRYINVEEHI